MAKLGPNRNMKSGLNPNINELSTLGGKLLFMADIYYTDQICNVDSTLLPHELWVTDGTTAVTFLVKIVNQCPNVNLNNRNNPDIHALSLLDALPIFTADSYHTDQVGNVDSTLLTQELWVTDGTSAG